MKASLTVNQGRLVLLALLACAIAAGSSLAFAVPKTEVVRDSNGDRHVGPCCSLWGQSVRVIEPANPVPIVVTWSAEYQATVPFMVGLQINNAPCGFYGPRALPPSSPTDGTYDSRTFQWVIMPGDYSLKSGPTVIRLCGGGVFGDTDTIVLGFSTLSARVGR